MVEFPIAEVFSLLYLALMYRKYQKQVTWSWAREKNGQENAYGMLRGKNGFTFRNISFCLRTITLPYKLKKFSDIIGGGADMGKILSMQELSQLYDNLPCGIAIYTLEDNPQFRFMNRHFRTMLGLDEKGIMYRRCRLSSTASLRTNSPDLSTISEA